MDGATVSLPQLHWRFDGPIDDEMRHAALAGLPRSTAWRLVAASRDLDRLALSTVRALAGQRAARKPRDTDCGHSDCNETALSDALKWYRALGVRTIRAVDGDRPR